MTEDPTRDRNHKGRAFWEFANDLLKYALPQYGYKFLEPVDFKRHYKKIFIESFGDAVMLFFSRHAAKFEEGINDFFRGETDGDIVSYAEEFCKRTFKGEIPLMEIIAYCAFLLHTSMYCLELDLSEDMSQVVEEAYSVFYNYISSFFNIIGGWYALYRVAEQYVSYVNPTHSDVSKSHEKGFEVSKI